MERQRLLERVETVRTVGLVALAVGLFASIAAVTWLGVALGVGSTAVLTVVRVRRLRELSLTPTERTRLAATWTLFALSLSALLVVAVAGELVPFGGRLFWPLAAVTAVTLLAYRRFDAAYLPDDWLLEGNDGEEEAEERESAAEGTPSEPAGDRRVEADSR